MSNNLNKKKFILLKFDLIKYGWFLFSKTKLFIKLLNI